MSPRQPRTLAEVAIANLRGDGMSTVKATVKAAEACTTIWAWGLAARELGRWPEVAEYSAYWRQTERTSYRELAVFRRAFPTERTPQRLAGVLDDQAEAWLERRGAVLSAPADVIVA